MIEHGFRIGQIWKDRLNGQCFTIVEINDLGSETLVYVEYSVDDVYQKPLRDFSTCYLYRDIDVKPLPQKKITIWE